MTISMGPWLPSYETKPLIFQFMPVSPKFLPDSMAVLLRRYPFIFLVTAFFVIRFSCYGAAEQEKTLAMMKPDGLYGNYDDQIKKMVLDSGFTILREKRIQLDEHTARIFYAEHSSKSFFPSLVKYMTSGPVLVMVLEKENAVADWRNLIGPTDAEKAKVTHPHSIRALCGVSEERNCVHGSDSIQSALREISFFFGMSPVRLAHLFD